MKVDILGVHPVEGAGEPCWLIETQVTGEGRFDLRAITQREEGVPRSSWQAPYDEHQLSRDGDSAAALDGGFVDVRGMCRLAFFFHYLDWGKLLETPAGPVPLPMPSPRPTRLQFITYEPPG
jgi:hypothetical protein